MTIGEIVKVMGGGGRWGKEQNIFMPGRVPEKKSGKEKVRKKTEFFAQ